MFELCTATIDTTSAVGGEASLVVPAHPAADDDVSRAGGGVAGEVGNRRGDGVGTGAVARVHRGVQRHLALPGRAGLP